MGDQSIFLDFNLPTAATWFYFSLLLAIALFFKFSRLLSMRNLDVGLLFLPAPGLLLLVESNGTGQPGYVALLIATIVLLLRCLYDLVLTRRPALSPNLSPGGLAWLGGAVFIALIAVAVEHPRERTAKERGTLPVVDRAQGQVERLVSQRTDVDDVRLGVTRSLALVGHLAVVAALVFIGWRHFGDPHGGVAAATFYLLLPYTFLLLPYGTSLGGEWHHVFPTALIVTAIALYRRPSAAGLLLGVAAMSVYYPVLLFPIWFSFYGRNCGARFTLFFALGGILCVGWLLGLALFSGDLPGNFSAVWPVEVRDWFPWISPEHDGFWKGMHWAYRIPVFFAFAFFVLLTFFWPGEKDLSHVIALSAAVLLGTQLWYANRGGMHILWYLPLLLLIAFRPNLSACQPPPPASEQDWLHRACRAVTRLFQRLIGQPKRPVTATGDMPRASEDRPQ